MKHEKGPKPPIFRLIADRKSSGFEPRRSRHCFRAKAAHQSISAPNSPITGSTVKALAYYVQTYRKK